MGFVTTPATISMNQGRLSTSSSDYLLTQVMTQNLVSINGRKKDHGRNMAGLGTVRIKVRVNAGIRVRAMF